MSFILSTQAEVLKTKRTASFWLSILGAAIIPGIFFLVFTFNPDDGAIRDFSTDAWGKMFYLGWEFFSAFALPMYIILISTLLPQIEVKNHTWKQVFASPQSLGNIYFSKFATIHLMILFCFVLFHVLMISVGVITNLMNPKFSFLHNSIDIGLLARLSLKIYISILGITAIQYWLSLRFKNFVAPVGIGLALVIGSFFALNFHWEHVYKYPYAFPFLSANLMKKAGRPFLENHEWNSIGYFVFFTLLGFLEMKMRKEKG
jgi:lantibiotic transport system permease protein